MSNSAGAQRRWLEMFCLAIAAGMMIWGRTFFQPHLSGRAFVLYWAACILFALAAVGFAVADIWFTLRALQDNRRHLTRAALEQIQPNDNDLDDRDAAADE